MFRLIGCGIRLDGLAKVLRRQARSVRLALVMVYGIISIAVHYSSHEHSHSHCHSMAKSYGVSILETASHHEDYDSVCVVCQWLKSSNHHVTKLNPHFLFIPPETETLRLEYIGNMRKFHSATPARGPPKA